MTAENDLTLVGTKVQVTYYDPRTFLWSRAAAEARKAQLQKELSEINAILLYLQTVGL